MKYVCDVCGWEYNEAEGYPEGGIAPGTRWEDIPEDFECPLCSVAKDMFSEGQQSASFPGCTPFPLEVQPGTKSSIVS